MGLHHTTSAYFNIFCVGYINFTAGLIIIFILLLFLLLTSLKAILNFPKKGMSFISWMCRSNACIMWCVSSDRACYMVITYSLSTVVDTNRPFWTLLTYQVQHWHILPPCGSIQASPIQDQDTLLFDTICAKVYASSLENVKKKVYGVVSISHSFHPWSYWSWTGMPLRWLLDTWDASCSTPAALHSNVGHLNVTSGASLLSWTTGERGWGAEKVTCHFSSCCKISYKYTCTLIQYVLYSVLNDTKLLYRFWVDIGTYKSHIYLQLPLTLFSMTFTDSSAAWWSGIVWSSLSRRVSFCANYSVVKPFPFLP